MVFDRTEDEPEEWDPEETFYDTESDGLTIPQVSTDDDGPDDDDVSDLSSTIEPPTISTAETDVPDDVLETFWTIVLVLNAAVLVVSLGVMFIAFEGSLTRGGALVAGGVVLFAFAGRRYVRFREDDGSGPGRDSDERDADERDADERDATGSDAKPLDSRSDGGAEITSNRGPQ